MIVNAAKRLALVIVAMAMAMSSATAAPVPPDELVRQTIEEVLEIVLWRFYCLSLRIQNIKSSPFLM